MATEESRPAQPAGRYLPAHAASWTSLGTTAGGAFHIRAAGTVRTGEDNAGPEGIARSNYEQQLAKRRVTAAIDQRVLPSAPYLALIGRVCSTSSCSEPFLVGNFHTVCPPDDGKTGELQVWTNNYTRVDGRPTVQRFSEASGGFWLNTEPAPAGACGAEGAAATRADDAVLASGEALKKPGFVISSRQNYWKPFFLPLHEPVRIRSTGRVQPVGGAEPTGPNGRVVPGPGRWTYPGTPTVFIDAEHRLFDSALPYLALIGRLCKEADCREPFLVGADRVVCPTDASADRIELWINRIVQPQSAISAAWSMTMETFDVQASRGEYQFEVSRAPRSACPARVQP